MSVHSLCICSKSACIPANIPTKTEYTLTEKKKKIQGHSQTDTVLASSQSFRLNLLILVIVLLN